MTTDRRTYSRLIFPYILILFLSEAWIFDIEFMLCPLNHCSMVNILSMSVSIRYSIRHLRIKYMFPIHIFETFLTGKVRWSVHQSRQWCSGNYVLYTLCRKTININSSITFFLLQSTKIYMLKKVLISSYSVMRIIIAFDDRTVSLYQLQLIYDSHHMCILSLLLLFQHRQINILFSNNNAGTLCKVPKNCVPCWGNKSTW